MHTSPPLNGARPTHFRDTPSGDPRSVWLTARAPWLFKVRFMRPVSRKSPLSQMTLDSTYPVSPGAGGMETRVTLRPGDKGTKKLVEKFGDQLLCVRYRYAYLEQVRYKTVELVIERIPWKPGERSQQDGHGAPGRPPVLVGVRVRFEETELRQRVKAAGGRWSPERRLWVMPLSLARKLHLADRLVPVPDGPQAG